MLLGAAAGSRTRQYGVLILYVC